MTETTAVGAGIGTGLTISRTCARKKSHRWIVPYIDYDENKEKPTTRRVCARKGCQARRYFVVYSGDEVGESDGVVNGFHTSDGRGLSFSQLMRGVGWGDRLSFDEYEKYAKEQAMARAVRDAEKAAERVVKEQAEVELVVETETPNE